METQKPQDDNELYKKNVILIDDEQSKMTSFKEDAGERGYCIIPIEDSRMVVELENITRYPVFIVDYDMPYLKGNELIPIIREKHPFAYIILFTGFPGIDKYNIIKEIFLKGADFWVEKGDIDLYQELWNRIDYGFRRLQDPHVTPYDKKK